MALSLRNIVLLVTILCGAQAEPAKECEAGEQCVIDDIEESALLQTKVEPQTNLPNLVGDLIVKADPTPAPPGGNEIVKDKINELELKVNNNKEPSQLNLVDALAKFDKLQASIKNIKYADAAFNFTTDPDESNEDNALELLSARGSSSKSGCAQQPTGWNGCAWGGRYSVPAFCAKNNRLWLSKGQNMNYQGCAFLVAQNDNVCESGYFYTTSTSLDTYGACKCCKNDGPYYASSSCNWVYYASSSSCKIR